MRACSLSLCYMRTYPGNESAGTWIELSAFRAVRNVFAIAVYDVFAMAAQTKTWGKSNIFAVNYRREFKKKVSGLDPFENITEVKSSKFIVGLSSPLVWFFFSKILMSRPSIDIKERYMVGSKVFQTRNKKGQWDRELSIIIRVCLKYTCYIKGHKTSYKWRK